MSKVTRRSTLGLASALLAQRNALPQAGAKPNILWVLSEDISTHLACYGEPLVQTPNLDRFATQGARFERAYCTAPVCSASRSALITGQYQTSFGGHNHRTVDKKPLPTGVRLITDRLREAGYFNVLASAGPQKRGMSGAKGSGKTDFNFLADNAFDGYDWNQRKPGQPFFAHLSIQESHKGGGWPLARKTMPRIDQAKLNLPPYWPDHPVARDEYANYLEAIELADHYFGQILQRLDDEGLAENTLVFFFGDNGACTFRSKQFLYEGGIRVPLLARWAGRIERGTVRRDMVNLLDVTAASLAAAGLEVPATLHGRDMLNRATPARTHIYAARDRCDIAIERMRCVLDERFKYIRNFMPGVPYMQRNPYKEKEYPTWNLVKQLAREGKLTPVQALFTAEGKPVEELYDLQADPHEVNNLATRPEQRQRLLAMRALIDKWVVETNDHGRFAEDPVPVYADYFKQA